MPKEIEFDALPPGKLVRPDTVCSLIEGMTRSGLIRASKNGKFPPAVRIGNRLFWRVEDVRNAITPKAAD